MKYSLEFIGMFEQPVCREQFLQHIPELINIKLTGKTDFVLADLKKELIEQLISPEQQEAVESFIGYQLEEDNTLDTSVLTHDSEDEVTWVAFSLHKNN
jgi:hypothetical protein